MALVPFEAADRGNERAAVHSAPLLRRERLEVHAVRNQDETVTWDPESLAVHLDLEFRDRDEPARACEKGPEDGPLRSPERSSYAGRMTSAVEGDDVWDSAA